MHDFPSHSAYRRGICPVYVSAVFRSVLVSSCFSVYWHLERAARTDLKLIAPHQIRSFVLGVEQEIEASEGEAGAQPSQIDAQVPDQDADKDHSGEQAQQLTLFP